MSEEHQFDIDTTVTSLGDGRYGANVSENWWIVRGPNGGYVAALLLRALTAADERPPRSLTIHFTSPPAAGPAEIEVLVERSGRSATFLSARLTQEGKLRAIALCVLAEEREGFSYEALQMPEVGPPGELFVLPTGPGRAPRLMEQYRLRYAIGPDAFSGSDEAISGGWIATTEPRPVDDLLVAAFTDAWLPVPFVMSTKPLFAPTLDLTIHFRETMPARGEGSADPVLTVFRSALSRGGYFEEDGEMWSADGRLLAQSRQLALLVEPDSMS